MPDSIYSPEFRATLAQAVTRPPFPSPEDWRDQWIYFLLVDRFNNPDFPPEHPPWDAPCSEFQGGALEGVRLSLDYLQSLGVSAIWLSPVLKNCQSNPYTYHGYGFQDLLRVDPRFGDEAAFERLVREAHARGIYVILDIVLNHAGDLFEYPGYGSVGPWTPGPQLIRWRDGNGYPREDWSEAPAQCEPDAAVWPRELRRNDYFRRQGCEGPGRGDFQSLKGLVTEHPEVLDLLIKAYAYTIARYDIDGFRIDTLKYLDRDCARTFGNAMREFALAIGKKNFFTFGEVWDSEDTLERFIGRSAADPDDMVGVDAALDYPLFYRLPAAAKGLLAPAEVARMYEYRKQAEKGYLSSHGEAGRYFVTFLENHDQHNRFYYSDPNNPHQYDAQVTLGLAALFSLQGIPCVYYGAEQGLCGAGGMLENVREALWGKPDAFDRMHPFYSALRAISDVRRAQPPLRYGRQYFRPVSGNGTDFGPSFLSPGILAFSRILSDAEVLFVANTQAAAGWSGEVLVDGALTPPGAQWDVLYSNVCPGRPPVSALEKAQGTVNVYALNGSAGSGPIKAIPVDLAPMEAQILARR